MLKPLYMSFYHNMINTLLKYLLFGMVLSACSHHDGKAPIAQKNMSIRVDGALNFVSHNGSVLASILIEIADTPEAQMEGLMGRNSLDHHHGMLFVFENIKKRKFRMLNTRIPLDIIFVGKDECILNIFENTTPMSEKIYRSSGPIKYAVEVRSNFTKNFKINESTCIQWQRF